MTPSKGLTSVKPLNKINAITTNFLETISRVDKLITKKVKTTPAEQENLIKRSIETLKETIDKESIPTKRANAPLEVSSAVKEMHRLKEIDLTTKNRDVN